MKSLRRLIICVIALLAGAVLSLTVSWGCAIWSARKFDQSLSTLATLDSRTKSIVRTLKNQDQARVQAWSGFGYQRQDVGGYVDASGPNPHASYARFDEECIFVKCGWPLKCVTGDSVRNQFFGMRYAPAWLSKRSSGLQLLPYQIAAMDFLLNSLMYGFVILVLTYSPLAMRRMIRLRQLRCLHCGYDLSGAAHDRCPECGNSIAQ